MSDQLKGLDPLLAEVTIKGKSVLDVGCAEGFITRECLNYGARSAHGVEVVVDHVNVAQRLHGSVPHLSFQVGDANTYEPAGDYDITLLLAVLHKLRDPSAAARRFARRTRELIVVRLPAAGAVIVDQRSGNVPHDIERVLHAEGFFLAQVTRSHFEEWCAFFKKVSE